MPDYIDRDAALAIIEEKQKALCPAGQFGRHYIYGTSREKFDAWDEIAELIEAIPAADVAPVVHGWWFDAGSLSCRCSVCGCKSNKEYNYCPNCGAKMDREEPQ